MTSAGHSGRSTIAGRGALILLVILALAGWLSPSSPPLGSGEALEVKAVPDSARPSADIRVDAFLRAYHVFVDSVAYWDDDIVFTMAGQPIHFQEGRMLGEDRLRDAERFDPIFYRYSLGPLTAPPPLTPLPTYSTDHLEALFGSSENQIRRHCRSISFLDHNLFVNNLIVDPLRRVEREIREAALADPGVVEWLEELDIAYSFIVRDIAKSQTRSLHGFGLAVDLVPGSYGGRHVYWQWSRVLDRENWYRIPVSRRWSPPQAVIEAFEAHGFVWGGKWPRFDTIHFEYRPEILLYNRLLSGLEPPARS